MISIRRQLTRELLRSVLLLLVAGLGALYFAARDAATDQFDVALEAKARAISTLTLFDGERVRVAFNDHFLPGFEDRKPRDFFQLWDADGKELGRSESLRSDTQLPHRVGTLNRPIEWNFTLPNGRPGRAVGFTFRARAPQAHNRGTEKDLQVVVASDREELDETLWQLMGLCAGITVLLVLATLWVIPRVLRRGLVPVNELGQQAAQIDANSLSSRFAAAQFPLELRPIAERLNDLLGRLEQSFERERRFSADLAHELRTPLTELRSMAECALKWPDARDAEMDRETLAVAQQMERIVTHILALARGEQGQLLVKTEPVQLDGLLAVVWADYAPGATERGLEVHWEVSPGVAKADPGLLRSILTNLFENAVDYAAAGGRVWIACETRERNVTITVANTVADLAAADLPKLFDRFWRKESARSGGNHLGLGLSLSRSFASAMCWQLNAEFDENRRVLTFILSAPAESESSRQFATSVQLES